VRSDPLAADLADLLGARLVLQAQQRGDESLTDTARRLVEEAKRPRVIESPASPLSHLKTPKQIAESCPGLTLGAVRKHLFRSETNGLAAHVIRQGRRVLIDEVGYLAWLRGPRRGCRGGGG
jgi:hypothetical protein